MAGRRAQTRAYPTIVWPSCTTLAPPLPYSQDDTSDQSRKALSPGFESAGQDTENTLGSTKIPRSVVVLILSRG